MTKGLSISLRVLFGTIIILLLLLNIEEFRSFLIAFFIRVMAFIERNLITMVMSFLFVKGKFVWVIFLKKVALLSVTGLGKRYLTEKVFLHHLKVNLFNPLREDIRNLVDYTKKYFTQFSFVKKIIAIVIFLSSLSYIAKSMGIFLAIRVILAKIWSFLLAFVIKISSAFIYFFTDYIWDSWITPIIEIFVFTWFFSLMEKVPLLNRFLKRIYTYFQDVFRYIEGILEKLFHIPIRVVMRFLVKSIRALIRKFIDIPYKSPYKKLQYIHNNFPNSHLRLKAKRAKRAREKSKKYISIIKRLKSKREEYLARKGKKGVS